MIKIAICDDDESVCNEMFSIVTNYFTKIERLALVKRYQNGYEFLKDHIRFDIIFLDIEMPQLDGIETAIKLRKWDVNSKIIYLTNYGIYKDRAFKVHAFDYLNKPVSVNNIINVLNEIMHYLDNICCKRCITFSTIEGRISLEIDEIYYFEYISRKLIIHSFKKDYITMYSLKEVYEKVRKYNFAYPHKSFIVNLMHVKLIKGFDVVLDDNIIVPLAQKRAVDFKSSFNDFLQSTFDLI